MKSNVIDVNVAVHARTDLAVLVSDTGDNDDAVWLPLSQIEIEDGVFQSTITLPEWLAMDKGLI